jgi:hypothetical protein
MLCAYIYILHNATLDAGNHSADQFKANTWPLQKVVEETCAILGLIFDIFHQFITYLTCGRPLILVCSVGGPCPSSSIAKTTYSFSNWICSCLQVKASEGLPFQVDLIERAALSSEPDLSMRLSNRKLHIYIPSIIKRRTYSSDYILFLGVVNGSLHQLLKPELVLY